MLITEQFESLSVVQTWLLHYREAGLAGLADWSRRPRGCPGETSAEVEALICELRGEHPRWGARPFVMLGGLQPPSQSGRTRHERSLP